MKKTIYLFFACFLISISINAQLKKGKDFNKVHKKIKTLKIAHLTEQLNLTEKEAEKFWPIYNKYNEKMMLLRHVERINIKKKVKKLGGIDALSEIDAKEITEKIVSLDKEIYETKQFFFTKLSNVLSYQKILKLEISEKEFNRKLLRKFRGKHKIKK